MTDTYPAPTPLRTLVAGIGNIFLGDDGFGVEAVRRLAQQPLPEGVETVDIGVRGVHLAYQLLDGYHTVVLVDAMARGGDPGTVYLVEDARVDRAEAGAGAGVEGGAEGPVLDGHRMSPDAVLALLDHLSAGTGGSKPQRVVVVGCEPASVAEGIGLSEAVSASLERAVAVVLDQLPIATVQLPETD